MQSMWYHIKIPFKPPKSKLYEVLNDADEIGRDSRLLDSQIESVYPKLVKQIEVLKNKLAELRAKGDDLEDQKSQLNQDIEKLEDQKSRLEFQIEKLKEKNEHLKERLAKAPKSSGEGGELASESHVFADMSKEYVDIEERRLDEHGQPGDLY